MYDDLGAAIAYLALASSNCALEDGPLSLRMAGKGLELSAEPSAGRPPRERTDRGSIGVTARWSVFHL